MLRLAAAVILGAQMSAALAQSAGSIDRPGAGGAVTNHNGAVNHSTGTMARVPLAEERGSVDSSEIPQNVVTRAERSLNDDGTITPPQARVISPAFQ